MFKSGWTDQQKTLNFYLFSSFYHQQRFQNLCSPNLWLLYVLLLSVLKSIVSCEFTYGYEGETYLSGVLNITYVDPESGVVVQKHLLMTKVLPGETEQVTGIVYHVSSNNHSSHEACHPLDSDTLPDEPFIALIKYGNCRDQVKLRHVADANAAAALLYHDNHNTRFIKVERQVNRITFAVINQKNGEWLAKLIANGSRIMMHIGISATGAFQHDHVNRTSVFFVSISFIILMMCSFAWLLFHYVQRFRYIHAKQILSRHLCSAVKKALDKIPVKTVKTDDREFVDDYDCCAVCIEPFQHGELMRTLPCNHCFHKICIDPWLLEQRSCPMCKLDILLHFGLVYTGSQESVLEIDAEEFRRHRASIVDHDIVLDQNQRRHSSVRVSMSRDGAVSPCSVTSLDPDGSVVEQSYMNSVTMDVLDIALKTSDSPSEAEYESSDEKWISPFPRKGSSNAVCNTDDSMLLNDSEAMIKTDSETYEICDVSYEN